MRAAAVLTEPVAEPMVRISHPITRLEFDPFVVPRVSTTISQLRPRDRVAVAGRVIGIRPTRWAGGLVLEVALDDGTGTLPLAFFGRRSIAGVECGGRLTVGGTVVERRGRPLLMNPHVWLQPTI
jgi:hypothetical protein